MFSKRAAGSLSVGRLCAMIGLAVLACLVTASGLRAQSTEKSDKPARKLVHKVDAAYPLDLQRAHIGGVVRLDVSVAPGGTVSNIAVVGGNPVLVETATRAVKQWKWAPADSESIIRVTVNFVATQ